MTIKDIIEKLERDISFLKSINSTDSTILQNELEYAKQLLNWIKSNLEEGDNED